MNTMIGRLARVALREVWRHEAYDFTKWLQENIEVLNEVTDLELVSVEREQAAGSFSIDLVADDPAGNKVIIENQLEKSNHDHLGKLITYMVAMEARAAVWIVSDPRPEHVSAIAWLNESSSGSFFLVKVEAVRIGDSPAAPLLTLIVGPSEEIEEVARSKREYAGRAGLLHRWWSQLVKNPAANEHSHITPGSYHWIGASSGVRGVNFNYTVSKDQNVAEVYIDRGKGSEEQSKQIFDHLAEQKAAIESRFGGPLSWERLEGKRACRIAVRMPGGISSPEESWREIQDLQVARMNKLIAAIKPALVDLPLGVRT